jgi:hypothetical protein
MLGISFARWSGKHGYFLSWYRIFRRGYIWMPFCRVRKRYSSWLGFWGK